MPDSHEGVAADGTIRTGVARHRVPAVFEPVLCEAIAATSRHPRASLYVYGSVANGTAQPESSDVDLLTIDLPDPARVGQGLSHRFADLCRGVEVAGARADDFRGASDASYGNRVFLRHYCVHLAGPDLAHGLPAYAADVRAARGFNGDLGQHLQRWRSLLGADDARLGVRVARKTLLAVAGMVSVHDQTWTTHRSAAATRWSEIEPGLAPGLALLDEWATGVRPPSPAEVRELLVDGGLVPRVVGRFDDVVGLWPTLPDQGF